MNQQGLPESDDLSHRATNVRDTPQAPQGAARAARELRAGTPRPRTWAPWILAAVLALPSFIPLAAHYVGFSRAGLWPTGFIVYDTPYYLANARELFDSGHFGVVYSNPFSYDYASPRIYFQPLTLILGVLLRISRADPGLVFGAVGVAAAIVCARVAVALFDRFGNRSASGGLATFVAFFWGGGAFALGATLLAVFVPGPDAGTSGFDIRGWWWFNRDVDPAGGWWFLNLGRNLVLPTEAVYHALFFGGAVLILSRRFASAAAVAAVLSVSHPFTGLQFLAIVGAWAMLEQILRSGVVPFWFLCCIAALSALHAYYYLFFLPSFPEHRQLQAQWTLAWTLTIYQSMLAYGIVAAFALWRLRTPERFRRVVSEWPNRLLIVWLLSSLALENHELFVRNPVQPVHFTRGYSWVALFLLGLPTIAALFRRARETRKPVLAWLGPSVVTVVFLLDNAVWLGATATQSLGLDLGRQLRPDSIRLGYGLGPDQRQVLNFMNDSSVRGSVVLSEDSDLGYLATVYSPLRSWRSHYANTPWNRLRFAELRAFFADGQMPDAWQQLPLLVVFRSSTPWRNRISAFDEGRAQRVLENRSYTVVRIQPRGAHVGRPETIPPPVGKSASRSLTSLLGELAGGGSRSSVEP
jgi:hypothetical protein